MLLHRKYEGCAPIKSHLISQNSSYVGLGNTQIFCWAGGFAECNLEVKHRSGAGAIQNTFLLKFEQIVMEFVQNIDLVMLFLPLQFKNTSDHE